MTYDAARLWLVKMSLLMIGGFGVALIVAPATSYPMGFDQALTILQVLLPLFLGYLSSAIVFLTVRDRRAGDEKDPVKDPKQEDIPEFFALLVRGPFWLVLVLLAAAFVSFGYANWPREGFMGVSFPFDTFSNLTSLILGIHTATTSALVAYLFRAETPGGQSK